MSHYNNIIKIYDRMVEVSDQLHESNDPDTKGFDKAIFMLCHALKQFEGINLHIENRNLKKRLEIKNKPCPCISQEKELREIKRINKAS